MTSNWIEQGTPKVVLECSSEDELFQIYEKAKEYSLTAEMICDAARTFFKETTYTCCAIGPGLTKDIDKVCGDLKLL